MNPLFAFMLGPMEIMVLVVLGVLLFGRKLPEVGRSLGRTIVEFRKGYKGLEDELEGNSSPAPRSEAQEQIRPPQRVAATAPKFEEAPAATPPKDTYDPYTERMK